MHRNFPSGSALAKQLKELVTQLQQTADRFSQMTEDYFQDIKANYNLVNVICLSSLCSLSADDIESCNYASKVLNVEYFDDRSNSNEHHLDDDQQYSIL